MLCSCVVAPNAAPQPTANTRAVRPLPPSVQVLIHPRVAGDRGATSDLVGLCTALLELGVADLPGVVPSVVGAPVSPGLLDAGWTVDSTWALDLEVETRGDALFLDLSVCPPEALCHSVATDGLIADPAPAVAALLQSLGEELGRTPTPGASDDQVEAGSNDAYALRIAGRAARVLYGLSEQAASVVPVGRDEVERAVLIDPTLPVSGWIAGRVAWERGAYDEVPGKLQRGRIRRPSSLLLAADEAAAFSIQGKTKAAFIGWSGVIANSPGDARFRVAAGQAALDDGDAAQAGRWVDELPAVALATSRVAGLRADIAAKIDPDHLDDRLAEWSLTAPTDPEPVRRRIRLRVAARNFAEALDLVEALADTGATAEADELRVALLAALDRWEEAASAATDPELAAALSDRSRRPPRAQPPQ